MHTHHWHLLTDIPLANWGKIAADARALIAASPVKLSLDAQHPTLPPRINEDEILFNGRGAEAYEDFRLSRRSERRGFFFVKTMDLPYDLIVRAVLAVTHQHAPRIVTVSSDASDRDWQTALIMCGTVLRRDVPYPVTDPEKAS
jgi:hypothetical protein